MSVRSLSISLRRTTVVAARCALGTSNLGRCTPVFIRLEQDRRSTARTPFGYKCRQHSGTAAQDGSVGAPGKEAKPESQSLKGAMQLGGFDQRSSRGAAVEPAESSGGSKGSSWAGRILSIFPKRTSRALSSARLLQACLNNTERKAWYTDAMISSEMLAKHLWLSTNVWIVSRRLLREGEEGKRVQEMLFDELWRETMRQLRSIDVSDIMLKKYLRDAQQHTFNALVQFDHAYTHETPEERLDTLSGALWRSVFMRNEGLKEGHVRTLAQYVDSELAEIYKVDKNAIFQARLDFAPPPVAFGAKEKLASHGQRDGMSTPRGKGAVDMKLHESDESDSSVFSDGDLGVDGKGRWRASLAESGRVYFWNTVTKQTTFDRPEGFEDWVPCTMPKTATV